MSGDDITNGPPPEARARAARFHHAWRAEAGVFAGLVVMALGLVIHGLLRAAAFLGSAGARRRLRHIDIDAMRAETGSHDHSAIVEGRPAPLLRLHDLPDQAVVLLP